MNQQQLQKKFAYLLDDASILPEETKPITEEVKQEVVIENKKEETVKQINEGFETHVLCNECGSGELELSKLKTKIRCKKCGNVGLTESIVGLEEGKSMKLGGGGRFAKLKNKLKGKVSDPAAVAATIGRKKYGKAKFQKMAAKGKKKASK